MTVTEETIRYIEENLSRKYPHPETLLGILGACAGFGCQAAVREAVRAGMIPAKDAFIRVKAADGKTYFFGNELNQPLLEAPASVWNIIASGITSAGGEPPDILEIVKRAAQTLGTPDYAKLTVPEEHQPQEPVFDMLKTQWPPLYEYVRRQYKRGVDPLTTGWLFAGAAQAIIIAKTTNLPPEMAGTIVMEAAVRASKLDPETVSGRLPPPSSGNSLLEIFRKILKR